MSKFTTDKCLITELPATDYPDAMVNGWSYHIKTINDSNRLIILRDGFERWKEDIFFKENKHIIAGALINNRLIENDSQPLFEISLEFLMQRLPQLMYPKTPREKLDNLLKTLVLSQGFEGEKRTILRLMADPTMYYGNYFRSIAECNFYMKTLYQKGYIEAEFHSSTGTIVEYSLTHKGLEYYIDTSENGFLSNNCFVAMSFGKDMTGIRESIRIAVEETGFTPIFIDEQNINSNQTINDAIIAELKRSKFCIADFTEQRDGVYFESGYALGQGKSVIYCCRGDWFEKSHFDTKHFAHIIYNTPDELKNRLVNKIDAWIK